MISTLLKINVYLIFRENFMKDKSCLGSWEFVWFNQLNVKKIKMLRVTNTLNVKSNQGRNFKLSNWNNIERKIYSPITDMGATL